MGKTVCILVLALIAISMAATTVMAAADARYNVSAVSWAALKNWFKNTAWAKRLFPREENPPKEGTNGYKLLVCAYNCYQGCTKRMSENQCYNLCTLCCKNKFISPSSCT